MIAVAQRLRIQVFSMEVPGSNAGNIFHAIFYSAVVKILLEYSIRIF